MHNTTKFYMSWIIDFVTQYHVTESQFTVTINSNSNCIYVYIHHSRLSHIWLFLMVSLILDICVDIGLKTKHIVKELCHS